MREVDEALENYDKGMKSLEKNNAHEWHEKYQIYITQLFDEFYESHGNKDTSQNEELCRGGEKVNKKVENILSVILLVFIIMICGSMFITLHNARAMVRISNFEEKIISLCSNGEYEEALKIIAEYQEIKKRLMRVLLRQ